MQKIISQIVGMAFTHHGKPNIAFRGIAQNIHGLGLDIVNAEALVDEVYELAKQLDSKEEKIAAISAGVEAVQIEWISNGILVRGKGADGAFCNYYRDTSQFISQSVGSCAIQFVKSKEPKVGDTCVLYFGMSDEASK